MLGGTELTAAFFDLVRDAAPAQLSSVFFAAGEGVQVRSTSPNRVGRSPSPARQGTEDLAREAWLLGGLKLKALMGPTGLAALLADLEELTIGRRVGGEGERLHADGSIDLTASATDRRLEALEAVKRLHAASVSREGAEMAHHTASVVSHLELEEIGVDMLLAGERPAALASHQEREAELKAAVEAADEDAVAGDASATSMQEEIEALPDGSPERMQKEQEQNLAQIQAIAIEAEEAGHRTYSGTSLRPSRCCKRARLSLTAQLDLTVVQLMILNSS